MTAPSDLGHDMGKWHDGKSYCLHQGCSASVWFEGPLAGGDLTGPGVTEECPYIAPLAVQPRAYCGDCDGTGWTEGGPTIKTTCSRCGGSGWEPTNA